MRAFVASQSAISVSMNKVYKNIALEALFQSFWKAVVLIIHTKY